MFTSRAEYRLQLREDNADLRLTPIGRELGLVDDARWGAFARKRDAVAAETLRLRGLWVAPNNPLGRALADVTGVAVTRENTVLDLLRRPEFDYARLAAVPGIGQGVSDAKVAEQIEIEAKYAGYLDRQREDIARQQRNEAMAIPKDCDYAAISGLSAEVRQKLALVRPETVGQAGRISGVTPAAISLLLVHLARWKQTRAA